LLYFHDQELTVDNLLETRKQSALLEAEDSELKPEPEPDPGTQGRAITVSKLTECLGLNETCIKVFEDVYPKGQQAATIIQGIMRILAWYEEILQEKKKSLSRQISVLDFLK
jgi:hypothetical protein